MSDSARPTVLVVERARHAATDAWQVGYEVGGRRRVWAGGVSEEALAAVIRAERRRHRELVVQDRR